MGKAQEKRRQEKRKREREESFKQSENTIINVNEESAKHKGLQEKVNVTSTPCPRPPEKKFPKFNRSYILSQKSNVRKVKTTKAGHWIRTRNLASVT